MSESSELAIFEHPDWGSVRTCTIDGDPWFSAGDVSRVLGYRDAYNGTRGLDEDELATHSASSYRGQPLSLVSEAGLYTMIVRSRKPIAKAFRRWVTHDVLPAIRKTGTYTVGGDPGGVPVPRTMVQALETALENERARLAAEEALAVSESRLALTTGALEVTASRLVEAKAVLDHATVELVATKTTLAEQAPKIDAYDALIDADGYLSMATAAKILGYGPIILFRVLRDMKILQSHPETSRNIPYEVYRSHFAVVMTPVLMGDRYVMKATTKVLPEGMPWLRRRLAEHAQKELPQAGSGGEP